VYPAPGVYRFTTIVWYTGGCIAEHTQQVVIKGSNHHARLQLSPNPATTVLHVSFQSVKQEKVTVYIFNASGVLVKTASMSATAGVNNWTVDVSPLPSGVYSVVVRSGTQLASAIFTK
jgi:hypothetical protein